MKKILIVMLALLLVGCSKSNLEDISGYYEGNITINEGKLPISLNFVHDDKITGTLDIKVQGMTGIELRDISSKDNTLKFMVDLVSTKVYFSGVFEEETYSGIFTQNGMEYDFSVSKKEKVVKDYVEPFELKVDNITLSGELMLPLESNGSIAIIIAGSGMTDLDGNSSSGVYANSYLYLAEALRKEGIATLRYNKRIINNPVNEAELSFDDFVEDAEAIVQALKNDIRFDKIHLIGHSQGALVAEIVASRTEIDKVILLAGAGRTIDQIILDQISGQVDEATFDEAKKIFKELKSGNMVDEVPEILNALLRKSVQPFLISWIKYDPVEILKTVDEDTQIIVGTVDLQVPASEGELLYLSKKDAQFDIIKNMNHVLKVTTEDQTENLATYQNIDLPVHSELISKLIQFLNE